MAKPRLLGIVLGAEVNLLSDFGTIISKSQRIRNLKIEITCNKLFIIARKLVTSQRGVKTKVWG